MTRKKTKELVDTFYESVTDIDIKELIPNVIDNVMIIIDNEHHTLVVPMNFSGIQFRSWHKGKGGVFSRDILNLTRNKPYGKYVIIKNNILHCVARLIDDEEELMFQSLKLINGIIKDKSYMILKKIKYGETLSGIQDFKNETIVEREEASIIPVSRVISEESEVEYRSESISLFKD
jgi:hypothetical protein